MYLGNTNDQPRIHGCQRQAIDDVSHAANTGVGRVFRIGVLITDDCSLGDVAKVLAKTCERFGAGQHQANDGGKISVTVIADRSGFLLRGDSSIPVWCEAIGDVNPEDFHCFVAPQPTVDASAQQPAIVSQLAQLEGEAKLILLSLHAETDSTAHKRAWGSLKYA